MRSAIRIAGPLGLIFLGVIGYFLYFYPLGSALWTYQTRMSWAGIAPHQADLKEGKITWYESGFKGEEAVLLVHGLGAEGALEWRANMAPISEGHFRVIAVDLMGFGGSAYGASGAGALSVESPAASPTVSSTPTAAPTVSAIKTSAKGSTKSAVKLVAKAAPKAPAAPVEAARPEPPPEPMTLESEARVLWELLDGLKIDQANLVGRDIGADIILQMAIDAPERAQRLVLISGGLLGKQGLERERQAYLIKDASQVPQFASLTLVGVPQMPAFMYNRMYGELAVSQDTSAHLLDDAEKAEGRINKGQDKIFNVLKGIIWGKNDTIQPESEADRLHEMLAGSANANIDNTGHVPNEEHPDEFNDIMYTFLKQ